MSRGYGGRIEGDITCGMGRREAEYSTRYGVGNFGLVRAPTLRSRYLANARSAPAAVHTASRTDVNAPTTHVPDSRTPRDTYPPTRSRLAAHAWSPTRNSTNGADPGVPDLRAVFGEVKSTRMCNARAGGRVVGEKWSREVWSAGEFHPLCGARNSLTNESRQLPFVQRRDAVPNGGRRGLRSSDNPGRRAKPDRNAEINLPPATTTNTSATLGLHDHAACRRKCETSTRVV